MRRVLLCVAMSVAACITVHADEPITGICVDVVSGDTIMVEVGGEVHTILLDGIDAPEGTQPYAIESKELTSKLATGKVVSIELIAETTSGEFVARVFVDDLDLSYELLAAGAAWHDIENNDEEELVMAFIRARSARKGLWSGEQPVAPSAWRQRQRPTPTPVPRPKSLAELADQMKLNRELNEKVVISEADVGTEATSTKIAPGEDMLVEHQAQIPGLAASCVLHRGELAEVVLAHMIFSGRSGTTAIYEIGLSVPDPESGSGKRVIRYNWSGEREDDVVRLNCSDLAKD